MSKLSLERIPPAAGRRARLGYLSVVAIGVAWGFVYLFAQLPREWRIAFAAVGLIVGTLLYNGYRAHHRTADHVEPPYD